MGELGSSGSDLNRVEQRRESASGDFRSRAPQSGKAGEDGLGLVELNGHDLTAVAPVPAQGGPFEELGAAKQEAKAQRVAQVDLRELACSREREVHVAGLEGLLEAPIRGAVGCQRLASMLIDQPSCRTTRMTPASPAASGTSQLVQAGSSQTFKATSSSGSPSFW